MMPSASSRISLRWFTADGFSILAMIAVRPRESLRASAMSSGRCTKESATHATPRDMAHSMSARSLSVMALKGRTVSGRLMPLRLPSRPEVSTSASMRTSLASTTRSFSLPSSRRSVWPCSTASKISGWGSCTRPSPPMASRRTKLKMSPFVSRMEPESSLPMRSLGPCRSTRMPMGPGEFRFELADRWRELRASPRGSRGSCSRETRRRLLRTGGASFLRWWRQDRA